MKALAICRYTVGLCTSLVLLAACSSGGSEVIPTQAQRSIARINDTNVCQGSTCIYAACATLRAYGRVNIYLAASDETRSPVAQITGKKSQLYEPTGVATDSIGDVYVAASGEIRVYGPGRYTQPPVRTIAGPKTGLNGAEQIAVDDNRNLYVANSGNSSITVYTHDSKGNVAPTRTIAGSKTGLATPWGIAVGFGRIYVTNYISSNSSSITIYHADSNGNIAPMRTISGDKTGLGGPKGIALDSKARMYVANANELSLTVYTALAKGNVPPISQISGPRTALFEPNDVTVDTSGKIYVVNGKPFRSSVTVYDTGAKGNEAPIAVISGALARLRGCEARSIDVL